MVDEVIEEGGFVRLLVGSIENEVSMVLLRWLTAVEMHAITSSLCSSDRELCNGCELSVVMLPTAPRACQEVALCRTAFGDCLPPEARRDPP